MQTLQRAEHNILYSHTVRDTFDPNPNFATEHTPTMEERNVSEEGLSSVAFTGGRTSSSGVLRSTNTVTLQLEHRPRPRYQHIKTLNFDEHSCLTLCFVTEFNK